MKAIRFRAQGLAVLVSLSLLSGCTQLPDLKPFADATAAMAGAMRQGYTQTEAMLTRAGVDSAQVRTLQARWEPTRKAVNAMVAYSDALAALGDAGNKGEESAGALISSLEGVQQAVGALIPGLPAIPTSITAAFRQINGVIAKIRARRALKEVIVEADDALRAAADILSLNFRSLAEINRSATIEVRAQLAEKNFALRSYYEGLAAELQQSNLTLALILDYQNKDKAGAKSATVERLRGLDKGVASQLDARLGALGPDATAEQRDAITLTVLRNRQTALDERVKYLDGERARIDPEYAAYASQLAALKTLEKTNPVAFSATVIETWAGTHSGIRSALTRKQRVTVSELISVVNELVELTEGLKKENQNGSD